MSDNVMLALPRRWVINRLKRMDRLERLLRDFIDADACLQAQGDSQPWDRAIYRARIALGPRKLERGWKGKDNERGFCNSSRRPVTSEMKLELLQRVARMPLIKEHKP